MSGVDAFEEYKLFVEDTARFTDRRQTVTNIYLTVNTILLSAVALLAKDAGLNRLVIALATLVLFGAGVVICLFWRQLILKYKRLVRLRMDKLWAMEDLPEMAGCQKMYHAENGLYTRDADGKLDDSQMSSFSDLERLLPTAFIVLYIIFGVGIIIALIARWI